MAGATGAQVRASLKVESTYGADPGGNYFQIPILPGTDPGITQGLIPDPILGRGRDPYTPQRDVKNGGGNVAVPLDQHNLGFWLAGLLGVPTTTSVGSGYRHRFVSGKDAIPSYALEIGHPAVPAYFLNLGVMVNSMAIAFATSGQAAANFAVIQQNEVPAAVSSAGTLASLNGGNVNSFSQFQGGIKRNGTAIGNIESADINYSNNLDPLRVIRSDGLISGADLGVAELGGNLTARFDTLQLRNDAEADTELELVFEYIKDAETKLVMTAHNARLPIVKQGIDGPGGIRATYEWLAAFDAAEGQAFTVDLFNDHDGTDYPS